MFKKLLSVLMLNMFIGITIQSADIATEKLNDILNKMDMPTIPSADTYYDIHHDGKKISIVSYKNHLQKDQQAISPHITHVLNSKQSTFAQKEEADFICYSAITKLKEEPTKKSLGSKFIPQNKHFIPVSLIFSLSSYFFEDYIRPHLPKNRENINKNALCCALIVKGIILYNLVNFLLKHFIDNHNENRFKDQLKQKTFFNLGNHSKNRDYSHLFKQDSPYAPYKKYFEMGKKEKEKNSIKLKSEL